MNNKIDAESVKVIVTSSPYNIKNSTGNGLKEGRGGKWASAALQQGYDTYEDAMDNDEYAQWQRNCLSAMMRVLRPDGAIFYNHKWRVQAGLVQDRHDGVMAGQTEEGGLVLGTQFGVAHLTDFASSMMRGA